jgi:FkbM family methyltransferase
VFDVGANVGDVTSVLLDLGARVVAVEPDPRLTRIIERYRVQVENVAVGRSEGTQELHVGTDPAHSSLSPEWRSLHNTASPTRFRFRSRPSMLSSNAMAVPIL